MRCEISTAAIRELQRRRIYLRPNFHYGDAQGKSVSVHGKVFVEQYARVPEMAVSWPGVLSVGAFSYIVPGARPENCTIGRHCSIATGVLVMGTDHPTDRVSTSTWSYGGNLSRIVKEDFGVDVRQDSNIPASRKTDIGHDVWIGQNALLKGGIHIGTGAVVGANAVVTKDVPPYGVAVGNPARVVKYRFEEELAGRLADTQWWNLRPDQLAGLDMRHVEDFVTACAALPRDEGFFRISELGEILTSFRDARETC